MRRFASDILSAKDIDFEFEEPENIENISLNTNLRREVFLIFKESINNIVKHSEASEVEIEFKIDVQTLFLTVKDNGKGFDFENSDSSANLYADYKGGNGLLSMKRRAEEMNGEFEIASEKGKGTIVNLRLPVAIQLGGDTKAETI
jgi:signal transduction histidine kinase